MSNFAWVTLTTNDTYSLGALVLAHSLRRAGTAHQLAVLVTPTVSESMRARLKDVYNVVQEVNVLDSQDAANLALLSRPELGVTFTKLHCWRLVQFEKCVFLDADTLVLQNCDELFEREELSAAPDVSWPDCFNSGVFVFKPSVDTFGKITDFAIQHGSFDGGDQGLLNQYFADWSTADIKKHLPFVYNVTAYASYCYLPAFKQFRDKIKILHFAGKLKPWLIQFNSENKSVSTPSEYSHAHDLIQLWWNIFCDNVHQSLTDNMCLCLNILHQSSGGGHPRDYNYMDEQQQQQLRQQQQEYLQMPIQVKEYRDPWADYYENQNKESEQREENEEEKEQNKNDDSYQERYENERISENHSQENTANNEEKEEEHKEYPEPEQRHENPPQEQHHYHHHHNSEPNQATRESESEPKSVQINQQDADHHSHHHHHSHNQNHPHPADNSQQVVESNEAGLAGALSQLRLGSQRSPEQEEYENLMRRQCWESGQIDYAGRDSFDNIWKKISQTLESKPAKEADKTGSS